jgi:hypothetical protein
MKNNTGHLKAMSLLLILSIIIMSCHKDENNDGGLINKFYPRQSRFEQ